MGKIQGYRGSKYDYEKEEEEKKAKKRRRGSFKT